MSIALPVGSESVRCLEFAKANNFDPGGTALHPDVLVLIEVAEPWPKPVGKHPELLALVKAVNERNESVRLLAAIPGESPPRAIAFRPTATGMTRAESPLGTDPSAALATVLEAPGERIDTATGPRSILVCTQGSHDICCGEDGARFADQIENGTDVELFRVSHTGGHRFSPTAMTLPDGRMWAYLTTDVAEAIFDRDATQVPTVHCRGWWGASTGRAQVAERAVFAELGFVADDLKRSVQIDSADPNLVTVTAGESTWQVTVELGREVPTVSCGAPGGLPVKPGREWQVTNIEKTGS